MLDNTKTITAVTYNGNDWPVGGGGDITDLYGTTWVLKDTPTRLSGQLSQMEMNVLFGVAGSIYVNEFEETLPIQSGLNQSQILVREYSGYADIYSITISTHSPIDYQDFTDILYDVSQNVWYINMRSSMVVHPTNITLGFTEHCTDPLFIAWLKFNATQIS